MALLLLPLAFILMFLLIGVLQASEEKETMLKTVLVFCCSLLLMTETAGYFRVLNDSTLQYGWAALSLVCISALLIKRKELMSYLRQHTSTLSDTLKGLPKYSRFLLLAGLLSLGIVFVQGVLYPPNNWDSMTYHMARIPHWIGQQSVEHFPTHVFRQVYQPPFAEFFIMHVNLLQKGDYFSNSVQLFFLLFSLFAILSLADLLGLSRRLKAIAVTLAIFLPEAMYQASATQNDLVASFFVMASLVFAVKTFRNSSPANFIFLGCAVGLAMLTKGTAYLYLFPMLLLFGLCILRNITKNKAYSSLKFAALTIVFAIGINAGHYTRNYKMNQHVLGVHKTESRMYANESMSPLLLTSNILKNIGLHMAPFPVNITYDKFVYKLHDLAGVAIKNPQTNFNNMPYSAGPNIPNHEDFAPNLMHLLLGFLSFFVLAIAFFRKKQLNPLAIIYLLMLVLQGVLFCWYLKWQPWHTRLHTPLFMLSVPLICYAISLKNIFYKMMCFIMPLLIYYGLFFDIINFTRPIITVNHVTRLGQITSPIKVSDDRYNKYFANNRLQDAPEYKHVLACIEENKCRKIGVVIGEDDWEYPLFCNIYRDKRVPVHIGVSNATKGLEAKQERVDCIVSTTINKEFIEHEGKKFMRAEGNQKHIWFYKASAVEQ